jgi:N-methylhydantoinase B/oxoprolinase/acetone carboxylase alpha subunit
LRLNPRNQSDAPSRNGGGGLGDPRQRNATLVRQDVETGLVSATRARDVYSVDIEALETAAEWQDG